MSKEPVQGYIPPPTQPTLTGNNQPAGQPQNYSQQPYQPAAYQQPGPVAPYSPPAAAPQGNPYQYQPLQQQGVYQAPPVGQQPGYQQGQHPGYPQGQPPVQIGHQGGSYQYDQQRESSGGLPYNPNAPMPRTSVLSKCPACGYQGYTEVEFDVGSCAIWSACGLFLITGIFCCWIPYVVDTCKDAKHYCRQCHRQIGVAKP